MEKNPPQSCASCHGAPNEADAPSRIGLKGAYHRQCIGCHERQLKPASRPPPATRAIIRGRRTTARWRRSPLGSSARGRDARVPLLPRQGRAGHAEDGPLDLEGVSADAQGVRAPDRRQPDPDGEQHLHRHRIEHAGVRVVPRRLRVGRREVRLLRPDQHRLSRLPRHHRHLPQGPRTRRPAGPVARPRGDRQEGRAPVAADVRVVPLRERRRRRPTRSTATSSRSWPTRRRSSTRTWAR